MLLFSDLHLREDSAEVCLGEVLPGILEACREHGERELACLGDFYHFRYRIDVRIQNEVRAWLKRVAEAGIALYLLPGNHDQVDYAGRNALEVFQDIAGVRVLNEPQWTPHGFWIPYRKRAEDIAAALSLPRPQHITAGPATLFMHHGIQGAWMSNHLQDGEGLPREWFGGWARVLCGHYHKRQTLPLSNVTYIGSPWQTKADEAGQPKGYALWNGRELTFVDRGWGPRYVEGTLAAGQVLDLSVFQKRDIVRIKAGVGVDAEAVGMALAKAGLNAVVTPEVVVAEARLNLPDTSSLSDFARKFLEQSQTTLDKARLQAVFEEVTR